VGVRAGVDVGDGPASERRDRRRDVVRSAVGHDDAGVGAVVGRLGGPVDDVGCDVDGGRRRGVGVDRERRVAASLVLDGGVAADEQHALDGRACLGEPAGDRIGDVRRTHSPASGVGVVEPDDGHGRRLRAAATTAFRSAAARGQPRERTGMCVGNTFNPGTW